MVVAVGFIVLIYYVRRRQLPKQEAMTEMHDVKPISSSTLNPIHVERGTKQENPIYE